VSKGKTCHNGNETETERNRCNKPWYKRKEQLKLRVRRNKKKQRMRETE
jgi:hypothetical protein